MTTAANYATREVSWCPSFYRCEQYDADLGLYYLRARYYNPATGRFLSRDPEEGKAKDPASLHKYLYAGGDPVNRIDPHGRASIMEVGFMLIDTIGEEASVEIYGLAEDALLCKAFDIFMEEMADLKLPWWYCDLGAL